jgi:hypothetical protein
MCRAVPVEVTVNRVRVTVTFVVRPGTEIVRERARRAAEVSLLQIVKQSVSSRHVSDVVSAVRICD